MEPTKNLFNNSDKQKVIKYCKDHILNGNEGGNGYCSLRYAAVQACPEKEWQDMNHLKSFLKSVSSLIIQDRKFKIRNEDIYGDFDIELNPDYVKKRYFDKHPTQEKLFVALISASIAFCGAYYISYSQREVQRKTDYMQDQQIQKLRDLLNQLYSDTNYIKYRPKTK